MLCNVAIFPTREASGKLLNLFLVSNPNDVGDFHQIAVPWIMIFLSCCFACGYVVQVWFMVGLNEEVERFYTMLNFLLDTFVRVHRIKVTEGDRLCSTRNWFDESVELAINERNVAYKDWHVNCQYYQGKERQVMHLICSETKIC
jgi:hypothetical protein